MTEAKNRLCWLSLLVPAFITAYLLVDVNAEKNINDYYKLPGHWTGGGVEGLTCNFFLIMTSSAGTALLLFVCFVPALFAWWKHRGLTLSTVSSFIGFGLAEAHLRLAVYNTCKDFSAYAFIVIIMLGAFAWLLKKDGSRITEAISNSESHTPESHKT